MVTMETKFKHLALVRREEVIELFKTGLIYPASSLKFNGSIESLPTQSKKIQTVFSKTPEIEYSINYFLLYAETKTSPSLFAQGLFIQDLVSIFPLDEDSARIGLPLSPPVHLCPPIFAQIFKDYQIAAAISNARKGIHNIGVIFGFDDLSKSIKKFNVRKALKSIVNLILSDSAEFHPKTIWEFLISYTRMQNYPTDIRGAFLDTMSVLHNFKNCRVAMKDQKHTSTGKAILEHPQPSYRTLLRCVGASENFVKAADAAYQDFWMIAPLYFTLLNIFSKVSEDGSMVMGKPIAEFVSSVVNNYDQELLKPALLMLGITLGQSSTYKMLYAIKKAEMPFLK